MMGKVSKNNFFYWIVCLLLTACSVTKSVPENDKLYTGASVDLTSNDLSSREHKVLKSDLENLARPNPNSRFLGIPFKLLFYNMFSNAKPNSIFGKFRSKFGEPPVLLSSVDIEYNEKVLQSHSENKGFFNAKVSGDTVVNGKKGKAVYTVISGNQYKINTVVYENDSSTLTQTIAESTGASLLQPGKPYDLDLIKAERNRIDAYLKQRGFYFFSPEYIIVKVDSTEGNHLVDMRVEIKNETPVVARNVYTINDVFIYSGYNLSTAHIDTLKSNAEFYEGIYVIDRRNRFKPKLFTQMMLFNTGEVYNRRDHNLTLSRLINLNVFKFVKNRFEPLPDTTKLDVFYYLTPHPKKSLRAEIRATTKSNNMNGTELSINWRNRNALRNAEQLSVTAYIGSEIQFGGSFKGYNTFRTGAEMNFAIPRFIIPFFDVTTSGAYVPRTNIQLGYDVLNRQKLYTVNSFRAGLGYLWKNTLITQHEFYPFTVNYVQPINVTNEYRNNILEFSYLQRIVDSQFILGTTYMFNYNEAATGIQKLNSFYFNGLADLSGNIAGLLTGADDATPAKQKRIFNAAFAQYIKLEADGRYYRRIGLKSLWANRLILGYGLPYGNSSQIPYIKQFFSGGNNSLRAFRSRSVGPGTFPLFNPDSFFPDQSGDIKLEINTEYRPHISGPLYGAIFLDAGNIWLKNEDTSRPGAKFTKDFYKQLAVGGGVGVRVDITLFVIRLDIGIPLVEPWMENPLVYRDIRFKDKKWRRDNIIYNLAIGYPF